MARAQTRPLTLLSPPPSRRRWSAAETYARACLARSGQGARLRDERGRPFLDLCNADGAVLLGWGELAVETAAAEPARHCEAEAAERLSSLVPYAEAVLFGPSVGGLLADALTAAARTTGRDGAFFCDDACVVDGDLAQVQRGLTENASALAAVVVRPLDAPGAFLAGVRALCDAFGAALIFEESRTALRVHRAGAGGLHGVHPDLTVFGPSIANGHPAAALMGRIDLMRAADAGGASASPHALSAACATLERALEADASQALNVAGAEIAAEVGRLLQTAGLSELISVEGDPCWSVLAGDPAACDLVSELLLDEGVFCLGAHVPSLAMGEAEVAQLVRAYEAVLPRAAARMARGRLRAAAR
ncbi:aminotransferase class III-fold pyridoxal phosphate-dependent enzyme [Brevundimonas sp. 2R-24]|uniref:Aminotransferase class III-fold pyridoxal phosphate-dependent enzyme n=1 Tax=Peiella sedimenti TaxID=3061083 RepID=A0ABT8SKF5_9CAUL|nr:aminotransferase class III-fold pyridoxal phosphate-dependent enzyme [Caulobacteraceae bacterium XZ-24]